MKTNKHIPLQSDVVGYQHTFKRRDERPRLLVCEYCGYDSPVLPGEYDFLMGLSHPITCPLCRNEMSFFQFDTDRVMHERFETCKRDHDLVLLHRDEDITVYQCSVCHLRYTYGKDGWLLTSSHGDPIKT